MKILLLTVLVAVAQCSPLEEAENDVAQWELFKIQHLKQYESEAQEEERKKIFIENLNFVRKHNAKFLKGEVTFDVAINKYADLTAKEFAKRMNGYRRRNITCRTGVEFTSTDGVQFPTSVDWRKKGAVTPVKDQGSCGSCWAFSSTGSLEGLSYLKYKKLVSLSEQNLVDCSTAQGNEGCDGGDMDSAFQYIRINKGIDTETSYPYEGEEGNCRYNYKNKGATDSGFVDITQGSEKSLQAAVASVGPISVAIDDSLNSFQFYSNGVYNEPDCSSEDLDHGVLVVGYGTAGSAGPYWLVKNSWGLDWGMDGYIMMSRNNQNMCGIATEASYPKV